jgi:hypothetical protein
MISAPRKLKIVMYELTTSITSLPEALYVLGTFSAHSYPKVAETVSSFMQEVYLYITVRAPVN